MLMQKRIIKIEKVTLFIISNFVSSINPLSGVHSAFAKNGNSLLVRHGAKAKKQMYRLRTKANLFSQAYILQLQFCLMNEVVKV